MAITYHAGRRIQGLATDRSDPTPTIDTTSSSGNTIITFTGNGKFIPNNSFNVEYLVVGGGGSGGGSTTDVGGGGGAGGYRTATGYAVTAQTYDITVGAGGAGVSGTTNGNAGGDSTFDTITMNGGGYGGKQGTSGGNSATGSGGGGGWTSSSASSSGSYGNDGGYSNSVIGALNSAAGGGGSSSAGSDGGGSSVGGTGGNGTSNSITGSAVTYAVGGGGGGYGGTGGSGGAGGSSTTTSNGTANTSSSNADSNTGNGSGGTGGSGGSPSSGNGGSGVVIIKFTTSGNTYSVNGLDDVQVGSRLEETDTRKMYHYEVGQDTEENIFNSAFTTSGNASQTTATDPTGKVVMTQSGGSGNQAKAYRTLSSISSSNKTFTADFTFKRNTGDLGNNSLILFCSDGIGTSTNPAGSLTGSNKRLFFGFENASYIRVRAETVATDNTFTDTTYQAANTTKYYRFVGNGSTIVLTMYPTLSDRTNGTNADRTYQSLTFPSDWTTTDPIDTFTLYGYSGYHNGNWEVSDVEMSFNSANAWKEEGT